MPWYAGLLVLAACIFLSAWGMVSYATPRVADLMHRLAAKYDSMLPEITIENGRASMKGEQPYHVDMGPARDAAIVIDTREGKEKAALEYLKDVEAGIVLTRDSLVTKNDNQVRTIPLKGMPNIVLNSRSIEELADLFLPQLSTAAWLLALIYFTVVKSLQALVLAMVPYFGARAYLVPFTYGKALNMAIFAQAPPVLVDVLILFAGVAVPRAFVFYFLIYVGVTVLLTKDLTQNAAMVASPGLGSESS